MAARGMAQHPVAFISQNKRNLLDTREMGQRKAISRLSRSALDLNIEMFKLEVRLQLISWVFAIMQKSKNSGLDSL